MIESTPTARLNEPHYVAWVRERQRNARRVSGWLSSVVPSPIWTMKSGWMPKPWSGLSATPMNNGCMTTPSSSVATAEPA